jgi:hypothetical protein
MRNRPFLILVQQQSAAVTPSRRHVSSHVPSFRSAERVASVGTSV